MTTKRDIKYSSIDLFDEEAFSPKKVKVRITTFIDEDLLLMLKDYANKRGSKYQTVLNSLLRSFFEKPERSAKVRAISEERVRRIVREELRKRA